MKRLVMIVLVLSMTCHGAEQKPQGSLTVICGPMCSGKTEELIRRINMSRIACLSVRVYKHAFDDRSAGSLKSRSSTIDSMAAYPIADPINILDTFDNAQIVAVDEAQFFTKRLIQVTRSLMNRGTRVIVSGLDMDFRGEPFGECMPSLLCMADEIVKLKAVCSACKNFDAVYSQRLVDGKPAYFADSLVAIDNGKDNVTYEPRCRNCFEVNLHRSHECDDFLHLMHE